MLLRLSTSRSKDKDQKRLFKDIQGLCGTAGKDLSRVVVLHNQSLENGFSVKIHSLAGLVETTYFKEADFKKKERKRLMNQLISPCKRRPDMMKAGDSRIVGFFTVFHGTGLGLVRYIALNGFVSIQPCDTDLG